MMMRQRVRAALRTRRTREVMAAALVLLVLLAGSEFAAARQGILHQATSLEIIAWTHATGWGPGQQRPPDVKVFDETLTHSELVHEIQNQLDGTIRGTWNEFAGCTLDAPDYFYELRFATFGVSTQVYSGDLDCPWNVTTLGDAIGYATTSLFTIGSDTVFLGGSTLDGVEILRALHQRTGMPLPSWWPLA